MTRTGTINHIIPVALAVLALVFSLFTSTNANAGRKANTAKNKKAATAYCKRYRKSGKRCRVEKCPCKIGYRKLKKFKRKNSRGYCVCVTKSAKKAGNRDLARRACARYKKLHKKPCWVHKGNCPVKRMPVKKFGKIGVRYSACRKKYGAERLKKVANVATMARPSSQALVGGYAIFMATIHKKRDRLTRLPGATIRKLQRYFRNSLKDVRIAYSPKAPQTCITDCKKIYCMNKSWIKKVRGGYIDRLLLHEIAHTEQCFGKGGRNRYALMWFRHLPVGVVKGIKKDHDKFKNRVHDKMPMEKKAEDKAVRTCGKGVC